MENIQKENKVRAGASVNTSPVELVERIIRYAIKCAASDIHIEPRDVGTVVRMRVDGVIKEVSSLPKNSHDSIISRLKILTGLRTDIRQTSQDGRFKFDSLDLRLSLVPTNYGEKAVIRLLASARRNSLESLGFNEKNVQEIKKAISAPGGMILVVGPTGSGKTSTLYTMLEMLSGENISIITLEDPIEYALEKITQIPMHSKNGFNFSEALRAVVRQDPDVIMVGEIRDSQTAKLAVQSALTGHLIFSTLHTLSSVSTIPRLVDMGIESYLLAPTVRLIIAQRLVRKICDSCKCSHEITAAEMDLIKNQKFLENLNSIPKVLYEGKGCEACGNTGYSGRVSISELFIVNSEVKKLIENRVPVYELEEYMRENGQKNMLEDGLEKVERGTTSLRELLQAVSD